MTSNCIGLITTILIMKYKNERNQINLVQNILARTWTKTQLYHETGNKLLNILLTMLE